MVSGCCSMIRLTLRTIFLAREWSAAITKIRVDGLRYKTHAQNSPTTVDFPELRKAISKAWRSPPRHQRPESHRAIFFWCDGTFNPCSLNQTYINSKKSIFIIAIQFVPRFVQQFQYLSVPVRGFVPLHFSSVHSASFSRVSACITADLQAE